MGYFVVPFKFSKNFNDFSVDISSSAKKNFDIRTLANMGPCANTDLGYVQSITDSFQWRHEKLPGKCEHRALQTRCF